MTILTNFVGARSFDHDGARVVVAAAVLSEDRVVLLMTAAPWAVDDAGDDLLGPDRWQLTDDVGTTYELQGAGIAGNDAACGLHLEWRPGVPRAGDRLFWRFRNDESELIEFRSVPLDVVR